MPASKPRKRRKNSPKPGKNRPISAVPRPLREPDMNGEHGDIRRYLNDLRAWVETQGVRPSQSWEITMRLSEHLGTSPADWLRYRNNTNNGR